MQTTLNRFRRPAPFFFRTDDTAHTAALTTYDRLFDADFDGDVSNTTGDADKIAWSNNVNEPAASTTMVVPGRAKPQRADPWQTARAAARFHAQSARYPPGLPRPPRRTPKRNCGEILDLPVAKPTINIVVDQTRHRPNDRMPSNEADRSPDATRKEGKKR